MKKREYSKIKLKLFLHSTYPVCIMMMLIALGGTLLLAKCSESYTIAMSIALSILTGVITSSVVTIIINIRLDRISTKRKKSRLFVLFFRMSQFNEYVSKEKPKEKDNYHKIVWTYIHISEIVNELEKVLHYYPDILNDIEFSVISDIITRYSFMQQIFVPIEEEDGLHTSSFENEALSLLKGHPSDIGKLMNNMRTIVFQEEYLEYLFYYERLYTDINRRLKKTRIFG